MTAFRFASLTTSELLHSPQYVSIMPSVKTFTKCQRIHSKLENVEILPYLTLPMS